MTVLEAVDVVKEYKIPRQKPIRVLDGVSLSVDGARLLPFFLDHSPVALILSLISGT